MACRIKHILVIIAFLLVPNIVLGEEYAIKSYPLPDHGAFQLKIPGSWKSRVSQSPNNLPPTIIFISQTELSYQVLMTPLWPGPGNVSHNQPDIKNLVDAPLMIRE